ncbi:hypothetical protein [Hyphococcus sp.]|uniref:hypothetical protein n=1 Tax=Hyphococcus sp. TaxID=2038636 RepID=UPI0020840E77|nr:MAG: hypothetical protein DHS20C04_06720 [Marinicaulis sp.]
MPAPNTKNIAFIDLEASGLSARSWPIEVGWCFASDKPQALLIKPSADWSLDEWSPEAEALHGVSHKKIMAKGADPKLVCEKLNAALAGKEVYSDAPDWDGFWLYRLFQSAKIRQNFKLSELSALFRATPPEKMDAALSEAVRIAPRKHRAAADVVHMRTLFELAFQE